MPDSLSPPVRRRPWPLLVLPLFLGQAALGPEALAQGLIEITGGAAIQGTVNSTGAPGVTGTLNRARETGQAFEASMEGRSAAVEGLDAPQPQAGTAAGGDGAITITAPGLAPGSGAPSQPATSKTRVNGRSVPICSHGGICHGALLRAMGIR